MIDNKAIEQARNTDIIVFLEKYNGFSFVYRNGAYRCKQHPSLAVKADRLSWYWHSRGIGGFATLDYLMKVENIPFREAVEVVTGTTLKTELPPRLEAERTKVLVLPEKAGIMLRLYDYLCVKRGISSGIVNMLIQNEMLYEGRRGNVVFVGYDELNKPRFASLRGTRGDYRGDCAGSDKRYSFNMAACVPSECLYVFESGIDLMSHATLANMEVGDKMAWKHDNRLSLAGTLDTAIPYFVNQHKTVKELVFCLDNDSVGREATLRLMLKYAEKGYSTRSELPTNKDFNVDLLCNAKSIQPKKSNTTYYRSIKDYYE